MNPFTLFGGASLLTKVLVVAGIVVAAGAAYGLWYKTVYDRGYAAAIAAIASADKRAVSQATAKRSIFKECRARGGTWSTATGTCD